MERTLMPQLMIQPHAPEANGRILEITPESAGWRYVGFSVHRLPPGHHLVSRTEESEMCIVLLSGTAKVTLNSDKPLNIGCRETVFEDRPPYAVYLPLGTVVQLTAQSNVEIALCTAPGRKGRAPRVIEPSTMKCESRGMGTNCRIVRNILPESEPADSLLIVEVFTPAGNWSSYPPHKHDTDNLPEESLLEEIYYYHIDPPQGFAVQRVYSDDGTLDETMSISDGSVVLVPRGYHPVGAPYGYDVYYLNVMAGPKRTWRINTDPAHKWLLSKQD